MTPTVLTSFLAPTTPEDFRDRYYGKQPLLVRGTAAKFAELFTWEDFNRLLNASSFPHPQVEIATPGNRRQAASASTIVEQVREGASLIFNRIQVFEPKIGALARTLQAEVGEAVNVNLYLSQPAHAAATRHYDRHDVFVLQIYGNKAWSVFDRTIEKPVPDMKEQSYSSPEAPSVQCELAPGDVLYIPRGHWHEALAQRGLSLHLTFGIDARTGVDFMTWLTGELRSDVRFREELPLSFSNEPSETREERLRAHVARLAEALAETLRDAGTVSSFAKHCVISDADAARFKFPAQVLEHPTSQLEVTRFRRAAHQRWFIDAGPDERTLAFNTWGHIFHFPKYARPLLEFMMMQTSFTYDDVQRHAGELTDDETQRILDGLLREGILDALLH